MQPFKPLMRVIGMIVPVVYCGGLLWYFLHGSGSLEDAVSIGLGPTLLGLGAVGLLFALVLLFKASWLVMAFRSAVPRKPTGDSDEPFDADALIARYKAHHTAEPLTPSRPPHAPGTTSFGRKKR